MYYRTYLIGLTKIFLILSITPFLAGFAAGAFLRNSSKSKAGWAGVAAYGLLEIAALIDKGRPLLFSNLIRIIAMNPPEIIAVSVGLVAGLLWLFVCLKLSMLGFSLACALRRRFTLKGESAN